uniref:hypothetical protein n=1 Tax=Acinetobacter baumannii TaxID=470 RepID=UPI001C07E5DE
KDLGTFIIGFNCKKWVKCLTKHVSHQSWPTETICDLISSKTPTITSTKIDAKNSFLEKLLGVGGCFYSNFD